VVIRHQCQAFAGTEFIVIGDGFDLLFVPSDEPQKTTRHMGQMNQLSLSQLSQPIRASLLP
jgi:hypothetical protein